MINGQRAGLNEWLARIRGVEYPARHELVRWNKMVSRGDEWFAGKSKATEGITPYLFLNFPVDKHDRNVP